MWCSCMVFYSLGVENDLISGLVYEPNKLWKKQDVTVSFINGDEKEHLYFRRTYFKWFSCSHINFREIPFYLGADIRVGFGLDGDNSWSMIGSDSAIFSYDPVSGKIFHDPNKTSGVSLVVAHNSERQIQHEGGHSLSLNHEHFHALANIS